MRILALPVIIGRIRERLIQLQVTVDVVYQLLPPQLVVLLLRRYRPEHVLQCIMFQLVSSLCHVAEVFNDSAQMTDVSQHALSSLQPQALGQLLVLIALDWLAEEIRPGLRTHHVYHLCTLAKGSRVRISRTRTLELQIVQALLIIKAFAHLVFFLDLCLILLIDWTILQKIKDEEVGDELVYYTFSEPQLLLVVLLIADAKVNRLAEAKTSLELADNGLQQPIHKRHYPRFPVKVGVVVDVFQALHQGHDDKHYLLEVFALFYLLYRLLDDLHVLVVPAGLFGSLLNPGSQV